MLAGTRTRTALRIDVVDNGPGVPEHLKERIFFPLVTGRAEGSGLGLALVKTFVEEAGGSITLESRPAGRTSRYCCRLKAVKQRTAKARSESFLKTL